MKNTIKNLLWVLLITLSFGFLLKDPVLQKIIKKYNRFSSLYHIQKVYVHTDKNIYYTGEHLWFKFYLLNDFHHLDTISKIGHIELISPDKKIINVRILRLKHATAYGDFNLPDTLPSGLYLIRAYTNFMKNFDEKFFFKILITINNPKSFWEKN